MAFEQEGNRGIEQGMSWREQGGLRFARHRDQSFLEDDALVAAQDGSARIGARQAMAQFGRHEGDLVAARLTLVVAAAQVLEGFQEEGGDKMRLQAAGLGALHLLAYLAHTHHVHHLAHQRALLKQGFQVVAVKRLVYHPREAGAHLWPVAVANSLYDQFAQRAALKLHLAQHVKDLAAQRITFLLQLAQQRGKYLTLACLGGDEVPEMADLCLPDAVNAPETLLQAVGVPGQVVVDHQVGALQVDALSGGIGRHQNLHLRVLRKGLLRPETLLAVQAAVNRDHRLIAPQHGTNALAEVVERVAMLGEDHQLQALAPGIKHRFVALQQTRQFLPFAVGPTAPHLTRPLLQLREDEQFGFQFGHCARRRCPIYDLLFQFLQLGPRRVLQVFQVVFGEGGKIRDKTRATIVCPASRGGTRATIVCPASRGGTRATIVCPASRGGTRATARVAPTIRVLVGATLAVALVNIALATSILHRLLLARFLDAPFEAFAAAAQGLVDGFGRGGEAAL